MDQRKTLGPGTRVARSDGPLGSDLEGETVLFSVQTGDYLRMNGVGGRVWKLLEEPRTVSQICEILQEEYRVAPEQCERDVLSFLDRLAALMLLRVLDAPAG